MRLLEIMGDEELGMDDASRMDRARRYGFDTPAFHGTTHDITQFAPFTHFGTSSQASMRVAGAGAHLIPVLIRGRKFKRVKDTGRNSWDATKLRALQRQGFDGVIYLNRYEGIPFEEFEAMRQNGVDVDRLSDSQFQKKVPSAADSYIVFDPQNVRSRHAAFAKRLTPDIMG